MELLKNLAGLFLSAYAIFVCVFSITAFILFWAGVIGGSAWLISSLIMSIL